MSIIRVSLLISLLVIRTQWISAQMLPNVTLAATQSPTTPLEDSNRPADTLRVTSRETIVDVTVTDDKGNPVHGLKQKDFTLKEDSKPQSIRSFAEFGSEPVREPEKLPTNIYTNQQPPLASSAVNVLLLDFMNLEPDQSGFTLGDAIASQLHVKQAAINFLHTMPAGTRVAVLGTSWPGSLRVLQGVTSDPALLSAAVDTMQYDTNYQGTTALDNPTPIADFTHPSDAGCDNDQHNRMTLEVMDEIAADLIGIKGRKNLIWFNHGIPMITDPAQRPSCLPDYSADIKKVFGLLTTAQVTVFPVDGGGLPVEFVAGNYIPSVHAAQILSMESVAEETGGAAYYNTNDLASAVSKAVETGSDYYTLTYVPPGTEYDGRHHTIHLDADKPGLHLTYRNEYYAEDPTDITPPVGLTLSTTPPDVHTGGMKAAMSRSMPTSSDLLFYVSVVPSTTPAKPSDPPVMGTLDPSFTGKTLTRYAFNYSISAGQFAFTNGPNATHNGSVELDLAAYDADAKLVTSLSQTVTMSLNDNTVANKQPLNFSQQIDLPAGQLFLRVGVLDSTSNKVGTLEIPLKVEKKTETAMPDAIPPTAKPDVAKNEPAVASTPVLPVSVANVPTTPKPDAAREEPVETSAPEIPLTAATTPPTQMTDVAKDEPRDTARLNSILQRLQENLDQYQAQVPSFFCDEHVVSKRSPDPQHEGRITDSTFRLKRNPTPDVHGRPILEESREVKMVNGKPADGAYVGGPTTVTGAFSGGLALVSLSQQPCMSYKLKSINATDPKKTIILLFTSVRPSEHSEDCIMQEDLSGRVLIDPGTMQIKHLEFHAPHHHITPDIAGEWDFAIDYAPVMLSGKSFWMPARIDVKMEGYLTNYNDRSSYAVRWSLGATYTNYHKLEVTSRILPGSEVDTP
jgi:VWFA-related protein